MYARQCHDVRHLHADDTICVSPTDCHKASIDGGRTGASTCTHALTTRSQGLKVLRSLESQGRGLCLPPAGTQETAKDRSFEWPRFFSFSRPNSMSSMESSTSPTRPERRSDQLGTAAGGGSDVSSRTPVPSPTFRSSSAARPMSVSPVRRMSVSPKSHLAPPLGVI